tara:strand:- start:3243 stop:4094 length:852 start_codon:yes stop_codon:yes gene_type:complete
MSEIEKIKKLRQSTGAGFKDCKSALDEAKGDIQKAVEILRIKGISKASKKMSRQANEGVVAVTGNKNKTSLIEINCETDFVAKNEDFVNFVKEISEINNNCDSSLEKLKISKMKNGQSVNENIVNLISKIGEKITIGRSKTLNCKDVKNYKYLHGVIKDNLSKLAVAVSLKADSENEKLDLFGKQLSMHIAASNPLAINPENISNEILDKEKELISEELKSSGKPTEIVAKISAGKLNKFKEENSLMTQIWVMDNKKKVKDVIKDISIPGLKIEDFCRIKISE